MLFSDVWSENAALFERLMEIHQYYTLALREMTMHFCIIFFQQDYPDMSLPMQGLALHRQMSGGDSEPLPGVSGSQQHIPLPQQQQQQQQQQGGAQQSSSGTHIGHPHSQQQQPPLLQLQHQPGLSQPGLSQQGLSQPYLVRQLAGAGGTGAPGSSPQAPMAHQAQQAQALGQQQGIPPAHQQVRHHSYSETSLYDRKLCLNDRHCLVMNF